jgi:hypothetical protein
MCFPARARSYGNSIIHFVISLLSYCPFFRIRFSPFPSCIPKVATTAIDIRPSDYPYYLTALTIFKNESDYLAEWIEYHLLVGVEKFFLIDNDSADNFSTVLAPYIALGIVNLTAQSGSGLQRKIYNDLLIPIRSLSFWVAVIDVDEFIVSERTRTVLPILRPLESAPAVTLNWIMFGTNGKLKKEPGLVMERFLNHTDLTTGRNNHCKSIVNPRFVRFLHIHEHEYSTDVAARDPTGAENRAEMRRRRPVHRVMWINHYFTKSAEEFRKKRLRGIGCKSGSWVVPNSLEQLEEDMASLRDSVGDDMTIRWAIPIVRTNIAKRNEWAARTAAV